MKILLSTRLYPDEKTTTAGVFIINQAVALKKRGHEVGVLFLDFRSPRRKRPWGFSRYVLEDIPVYRWAFPCGPVPPLIRAAASELTLRLYKKAEADFGRPDLIYAHFGDAAIDAHGIRRRFGVPYVVLEHDSGLLVDRYRGRDLTERRAAYDAACAVLAVSEALAQKLRKLTRNPVSVVPNILPAYMFAKKLRPRSGKTDTYTFIGIGNLIPNKDFTTALRAFAATARSAPGAKLLLVGDGEEADALRALAAELNIQDKVCFLGRIDNHRLPEVLGECDCFVLPSRYETFGVVYLEAMASGLPVIATRCGGPEEFVNDQNGILVPVGDVEALAAAMRQIMEHASDYDPETIRAFAWELCSEENVTRKLEAVFYPLIEPKF